MMMISGTIYLFPDYSSNLKTLLNYNVEQINLVGTLLNTGTWAGVIGGLFFDKFGPRLTSIGGGITIFLGYFLMYLAANKTIGGDPIAVGMYAFLAGQGSGWIYTAALNTNTVNFTTEDRGKIVGLLACCFGLCAGIFTLVYKSFFSDNVITFLGFLSIFLPAVAIIGGAIFCNYLDEYPKEYTSEKGKISAGYTIMTLIVVWMMVTGLVTNFTSVQPLIFCIVLLAMIGLLLGLVFRTKTGILMPPPSDVSVNSSDSPFTPLLPHEPVELPLWKVCITIDFWLLFFSFFAVIGSGIMMLNNLNEFVISLEDLEQATQINLSDLPYENYTVTFVILFSVFNTSGRLIVGMLSDRFMYMLSRSSWLIIVSGIMGLAQVYFLLTSIAGMFGGIFLMGIAYGGTFALVPTLTSELFGLKNFGANYGFIGLAPAVGSEVISVLIAGKLNDNYRVDHYITVVSSGTTATHCLGRVCYQYTLFVCLGLCALSIIASLILSIRQRKKREETLS